MFRPIFIIIFLFILAAFILQMISIFANFNGLRSVYIARIDLDAPSNNNDGGILGSIWNSADSILGGSIPDYLTLGLFVICEGTEPDQTTCTPPSLGFDYSKCLYAYRVCAVILIHHYSKYWDITNTRRKYTTICSIHYSQSARRRVYTLCHLLFPTIMLQSLLLVQSTRARYLQLHCNRNTSHLGIPLLSCHICHSVCRL